MVLRVRLLEVGGSTGGALGKAFLPFTFFCGTGAVGGGAKRSTSESFDWTSLPRGEANRGLERTPNSSSLDTGSLGRVAVKTSSIVPRCSSTSFAMFKL